MTVSYSHEASTATFYNFTMLLLKWRGSVWKLVVIEASIWSFVYAGICCFYYFWLRGSEHGGSFEAIVLKMNETESPTLLTMLLGFFTSITINRWWLTYEALIWPDYLASAIASHLKEQTQSYNAEFMSKIRQDCIRYIMLTYIFLLRDVSKPVKERFPDYASIDLLSPAEREAIQKMIDNGHKGPKFFVPLHWLNWTLKKLYFEELNLNPDDPKPEPWPEVQKGSPLEKFQFAQLIRKIYILRANFGQVIRYDSIPNPILMYTQVCILAVYMYVFYLLLSRQVVDDLDFWNIAFVYVTSLAQICCFLGWFKATEVMINPFGYDDDDYDVNWLLDRHYSVITQILHEQSKDDIVRRAAEVSYDTAKTQRIPHTLGSAFQYLQMNSSHQPLQASMADVEMDDRPIFPFHFNEDAYQSQRENLM